MWLLLIGSYNYCSNLNRHDFTFKANKGMAALVEEGLRHWKKHQPIEKDTTKPSSIETRL